jgi:hypothetical protein
MIHAGHQEMGDPKNLMGNGPGILQKRNHSPEVRVSHLSEEIRRTQGHPEKEDSKNSTSHSKEEMSVHHDLKEALLPISEDHSEKIPQQPLTVNLRKVKAQVKSGLQKNASPKNHLEGLLTKKVLINLNAREENRQMIQKGFSKKPPGLIKAIPEDHLRRM